MHRRYNCWHSRFDQPDPYGGSYDLTDPQSFNRYSYVQNDPVNFVDPNGLNPQDPKGPPPPPMPPVLDTEVINTSEPGSRQQVLAVSSAAAIQESQQTIRGRVKVARSAEVKQKTVALQIIIIAGSS